MQLVGKLKVVGTGVSSETTHVTRSWPASIPFLVAAVVSAVYALWLAVFFLTGHTVWNFVLIGHAFAPHNPHARPGTGYDGQWYYYIATDPLHARVYLDKPGYRYARILYPLAARLVAFGHVSLVPYSLVAINLVAVAVGTLAIAVWLKQESVSPWLALVYGFYPGLLISTMRDLAEPLSFALVALGIYLLRRHTTGAALCFMGAVLTRETSLLFVVPFGLAMLFGSVPWRVRMKRSALFLGLSVGPFLLYKAFLIAWLGSTGVPTEGYPTLIPFQGLLGPWPWRGDQLEALIAMVIPAMICAAIALWSLKNRCLNPEVWILLANIQLFVVMLNRESYHDIFGSLRVATAVLLAALYCLPIFDRVTGHNRWWFRASTVFWLCLAPFWFVVVPLWMVNAGTPA